MWVNLEKILCETVQTQEEAQPLSSCIESNDNNITNIKLLVVRLAK